jgi:hypothetical protein
MKMRARKIVEPTTMPVMAAGVKRLGGLVLGNRIQGFRGDGDGVADAVVENRHGVDVDAMDVGSELCGTGDVVVIVV